MFGVHMLLKGSLVIEALLTHTTVEGLHIRVGPHVDLHVVLSFAAFSAHRTLYNFVIHMLTSDMGGQPWTFSEHFRTISTFHKLYIIAMAPLCVR